MLTVNPNPTLTAQRVTAAPAISTAAAALKPATPAAGVPSAPTGYNTSANNPIYKPAPPTGGTAILPGTPQLTPFQQHQAQQSALAAQANVSGYSTGATSPAPPAPTSTGAGYIAPPTGQTTAYSLGAPPAPTSTSRAPYVAAPTTTPVSPTARVNYTGAPSTTAPSVPSAPSPVASYSDPNGYSENGAIGAYTNSAGNQGQSSLNPALSEAQSNALQSNEYQLGSGDNAQEQAMVAQAQNTGAYYAGQSSGQADAAGAASAAAANRGTAMYGGDTSAYNAGMAQSAADSGLQTGSYNALNQFAGNAPASQAQGALNTASNSVGNLNQYAANTPASQAQGALNNAGASYNNLNQFASQPFSLNAQGQLNQVGQSASNLSGLGNQIGASGNPAAGNLASAAGNGQSLTNFGNSAIGPSAGQANLNTVAGAANSLGQFAAAPIQNAAAQQFGQANQAYNEMQQFQNTPIGPSAAEQQLLQSTDANTANALAMARSGSGMGGDESALKQAMLSNAGTQQTANSQMAELRANENTAYQAQKLNAQTAAGTLAANIGNEAITQNDTRLGQQLQASQSQGDLANTAASTQINNQLQQQAQRQTALSSAAGIADTGGQLQITQQNNQQQNQLSAYNAAGALQNQAASTMTSAQMQNQANQLNALQSAGTLANQTANIQASQQEANRANQLAALQSTGTIANQSAGIIAQNQQANQANSLSALQAAGTLGTATTNADIARAQAGLSGAQYTTSTALQGTQLNDAASQAWAQQQQAATQQALSAEVGGQTQALNVNNAALAGNESKWAGINSRYATSQGVASNEAIAGAQQTAAYVGAGLAAAGTIGAAALTSDETTKDVIAPLGSPVPPVNLGSGGMGTSAATVAPRSMAGTPQPTSTPGGPSLAQQASARDQATGSLVGSTGGHIAGGIAGSAVGGPVGGFIGSAIGGIVGGIGGKLVGKLIGSDVTNKTNIHPLSAAPGAATQPGPTGAYGELHAMAQSLGAAGVATTNKQVAKYAAAKPNMAQAVATGVANAGRSMTGQKPMVMPPLHVTGKPDNLSALGPTGNPGDAWLASSARAAPPSAYTYKNPSAPGAAPGVQTGPMAQDLASHPVTAPAVGTNPATGKLMVDPGRLTLANTAQNHAQQNQLDALDSKINGLTGMLQNGYPTQYPNIGQGIPPNYYANYGGS